MTEQQEAKVWWHKVQSRTGGQSEPRPRRGTPDQIAFQAKPTARALTETFLHEEVSRLKEELAAAHKTNEVLRDTFEHPNFVAEVASIVVEQFEDRIRAVEQSTDQYVPQLDALLMPTGSLEPAELAMSQLQVSFIAPESE